MACALRSRYGNHEMYYGSWYAQTPRQEQPAQVRKVNRKYLFFPANSSHKKPSVSTTENDIQSSTDPLCKINDACQNKIEFLRASLRYHDLQVEPSQPGAKVSKKINYKWKKEFAFRMCKREPTAAMPKPSFLSEQAFSRSIAVMWMTCFDVLLAGWDAEIWLVVRQSQVR